MGSNLDLLTTFRDSCGFGLVANLDNIPTHQNLQDSISSLSRMMHRGAVAADGKSGDGSGLLVSMPDEFFRKIARDNQANLPKLYAVAMIFSTQTYEIETFYKYCHNNDLKIIIKREVPIDTSVLGSQALEILPNIIQIIVIPNSITTNDRFEAMLYLTRKECENELKNNPDFYIASFSSKVISYKGLVIPTTIKQFYTDLQDTDFKTNFALFHQRFSTNTLPQWRLAQPFRAIAHNGEINSINANRINIKIKTEAIKSTIFTKDELNRIFPILQDGLSDSASLDNIFEFLLVNGMDFFKAIRSLVPAPWQNSPYMDSKLKAFYEYRSISFEAWDGPAALTLTDGRYLGCLIDRNGLRPAKYIITKDDRLLISSEFGTLDVHDDQILERGRLQSGEMIGVDLTHGRILKDTDINNYLKSSQNYSKWFMQDMKYLQEEIDTSFAHHSDYVLDDFTQKQKYFNISYETLDQIISPMATDGKEKIASMGDDTPLACFSTKHRNFTDYFRQKFAQVTNPPIDPYREKLVMSLNIGFGHIHNILEEKEHFVKRLKSISPILMQEKMDILLQYGNKTHKNYDPYYKSQIFSTAFTANIKKSLQELYQQIKIAIIKNKVHIVILDDRNLSSKTKLIPMAMAVGFINKQLQQDSLRHSISIVAVTGEVYEPHSAAVLIAFGATAIYPYMMYASTLALYENQNLSKFEISLKLQNTQTSINNGLLKIMSKMGIATVESYRNSALFDILGLSDEIVQECFCGAYSDLAGLEYSDIEERITNLHNNAFFNNKSMLPLDMGGFIKYMTNGEYHDFSPSVTKSLNNKYDTNEPIQNFKSLKKFIETRDKKFIRDFFILNSDRNPIDISQVESKEQIFKRFNSAAMSCGSISIEAHEALAEAMNTIGGMSNSGEGGEDKHRFNTLKNSKIKQIASGRFGVTPSYLVNAQELQIKVAQGAKPGEGGQLPGFKVTSMIAKLRHTTPGVTLISPPSHHDIYSIEDLSQLIFDLKQINPTATITVKLVSSIGIGTIAVGVAKSYADKIVISGADGGTGAAPLSSIKHTGNAWELGLSEVHNALKVNNLRGVVHLQSDGGLKSGIDIIKAAILGAESYAFGTALLTILGCKILRICHTNKCSVGVATQDETLRQHFNGSVSRLIAYFDFLANDIQKILASLGYTTLNDIIGQTHLLKIIDDKFAKKFDFENILRNIDGINICQIKSNIPYDKNQFEHDILQKISSTIQNPNKPTTITSKITNINRSFGALISGEIARKHSDDGLPINTLNFNLNGVAGQSFGAFLSKGMTINLNGIANDYVGKGMAGGKIIIKPKLQGSEYAGAGNTCLYGATGGKLYIRASVGERFA